MPSMFIESQKSIYCSLIWEMDCSVGMLTVMLIENIGVPV